MLGLKCSIRRISTNAHAMQLKVASGIPKFTMATHTNYAKEELVKSEGFMAVRVPRGTLQ